MFETDDERTYFTTTLFIHPDFQTEEVTAVKVTDKVTDRVTDKVTDKEKLLLKTIEQLPSGTYAKYADILKISRKSVAELIKSLKEKGIIERIGSDRKGYWEIAEAD